MSQALSENARWRWITPLAALLLLPALALAQATSPVTSLKGRFVDPTNNAPVSGVQVKLTNFADTSDVRRLTAKDDGTFEVTGLGVHGYRLEATRLGYAPLKHVIRVTKAGQDAGVLQMVPEAVPIAGVTVTESPAPAAQKADTTEFRASAVKTSRDATAEDLVQKMPGVTVENGQVRAQGEQVQQVLVNGRPFFGSDPAAAMRNLPAEVVDRIQVYDRASDQAEFSGFEDGNQQRTMNFILRDQKAQFGKFYGGYGDRERYQAGGNATFVRGLNRLTLIGLSNNINQQNFSPMDLFGAMSGGGGPGGGRMVMMGGGFRSPGGGQNLMRFGGGPSGFNASNFFVGQQGGLTTTNSGGMNYSGQWGKRLAVTGSAFMNHTENRNVQDLEREYLPPQDSLAFYGQNQASDSRNFNQRYEARFEWTVDSLNSVILAPRLFFQNSRSNKLGLSTNSEWDGSELSGSDSHTRNETDGHNLSNRLTLRHRFGKRGRNVSADLNTSQSLTNGDRDQFSINTFTNPDSLALLDQQTGSKALTRSASVRIAYTDRLTKQWQWQATYHPSWTRSESDARTFAFDTLSGAYDQLDPVQSNSFLNRYTTQNAGLAALRANGPWRWLLQAQWQRADLGSEQTFPSTGTVDRTFEDVLPSMTLTGTFSNRRNLRLAWNTSTQPPSISQLQNVVDYSNPLALSTGNPGLGRTYTNTLSLRLSEAEPAKSRSRFVFLNVSRTSDPISTATLTAGSDTTISGIDVGRGTQISRPVNLDESWNANLFAAASRPAGPLKSIVTLNGGLSWTQTPTLVNAGRNTARTSAIRFGGVAASNISQNLDFTFSYQGNYNLQRNTLTPNTRNDYYAHTIGFRFNAIGKGRVVIRQELSHNYQQGETEEFRQNAVLWNSTLGRKFLKDDRGELRLTVTDALKQDRSIGRTYTESYVQDWRDLTLGQFVQMVFTYTFR
jgi:hypothetical protein